MAYLAMALEAILALKERNSGSSLLLRSVRSILNTLTHTNSSRSSCSFSPRSLCSAIEAVLRKESQLKAKALGRSGPDGGQVDPVGRLLRFLFLRVRASFKLSAKRKASAIKRKPITTKTKSHKKSVGIKKKAAAAVKKRPVTETAKKAKKAKKSVAVPTATKLLAKKRRKASTPILIAARAKSAGAAAKRKPSAQKKKAVVRRKASVTKTRGVSAKTAPKKTRKKRPANQWSGVSSFISGTKMWGSRAISVPRL